KKEAAVSQERTFHPIYHKMITKIDKYQEEALECDTLGMAILLHPAICLRFFDAPKVDKNNNFKFFNAPTNSAESRELDIYVKNMDHLATPSAKDQKSLFIWSKRFPVLSFFSKDYLVSSASYCDAEQIFSSAANGIQVTGRFEKAHKVVKNYIDSSQKTSKK
ncbi:hypothetical protein VP01_919g5, partial [Puccinia sorghi]